MSTTIADAAGPDTATGEPLPIIPGYDLLRVLGRGGMGCVYLARDRQLGREVAVKTLIVGGDPALAARFREEVAALAAIHHPNVLQVHNAGETEGRPFLVMEYVPGGTLAQALAGKPLQPTAVATLLEPVARAVQHCHDHGILHRDLKPGNILLAGNRSQETGDNKSVLTPDPCLLSPVVSDFGLAKRFQESGGLTRTGDILGTPAYMAPEQASGVVSQIGPSVDVYALGAILYECLTGRPPFQSPDPVQTLLMVLAMDPVSPRQLQPKLPRDLETICLKCLEKSPRKRYATACELADDLRRYLDSRPIVARPTRAWEKAAKWAKCRPAGAALAVVSVVALAVIVIGGGVYSARLKRSNSDLETSNDRLAGELNRSEEMFRKGHELARYLLHDHTTLLARLGGSTVAQKKLIDELLPYLDHLAAQIAGHERVPGDITVPELARAYERVAGVLGSPAQVNLDRPAEARQTFHKALGLRREYQAAHPDDPEAWLATARCLSFLAELEGARDPAEGRKLYAESIDLAHKAPPATETADYRWQIEVEAAVGVAELRHASGDRAGAIAAMKELLVKVRQAHADRPTDWRTNWNLAQVLGRLAEYLDQADEVAAAKPLYEEALNLSVGLADWSRDDIRFQHDLAVNFLGYGDLLVDEQNYMGANKSYEAAVTILRGLAKADPEGRSIGGNLAKGLEKWGRSLNIARRNKEAVPILEEGLAIARARLRAESNPERRRSVRVALNSLGTAYGEARNLDGQVRCYQEALRMAREDRDLGLEAEALLFLALTYRDGDRAAAPDVRKADLSKALAHFDLARDRYNALEKTRPLDPAQVRMRARIVQFRAEAQQMADALAKKVP